MEVVGKADTSPPFLTLLVFCAMKLVRPATCLGGGGGGWSRGPRGNEPAVKKQIKMDTGLSVSVKTYRHGLLIYTGLEHVVFAPARSWADGYRLLLKLAFYSVRLRAFDPCVLPNFLVQSNGIQFWRSKEANYLVLSTVPRRILRCRMNKGW